MVLVPVVLSGGSGTRLWPMSRELMPKQLLPLVGEHTMLQETLRRALDLDAAVAPPIVVCNEDHRFLVAEQLRTLGVAPASIILEPQGRNTAPAVAIAALTVLRERAGGFAGTAGTAGAAGAGRSADTERARETETSPAPRGGPDTHSAPDADALLLILPADHVIRDTAAFAAAVADAADAAAAGRLVTFGVVPTRPETGYGYLLTGASRGRWSELERFVEKPDAATAERYFASGQYLWNSGMFVLSARRYLEELERHAPAMLDACRRAAAEAVVDADFVRLGDSFLECPSDSIDYAVMEKTDRAAVVPLDAGWSDVGSWDALHDVVAKDADGNALHGDVVAEHCTNSYVAATSRLVAAVGIDGMVVVETADAVVVMPRARAQDVKRVVDRLKAAGRIEVRDPPGTKHSERSE